MGETDARVDLVRPTQRRVTGRLVAQTGADPRLILGFTTDHSYVTANGSADGTFTGQLQPATHAIELAGIPIGYSLASARLGSQDVSKRLVVGAEDISGLEIRVAVPPRR